MMDKIGGLYPKDISAVKKTYSVDFKVYEAANMYEIPFQVPEIMLTIDGNLKLGVHSMEIHCTEEQFDGLCAWCHNNGAILKIIGSEKLD
jgi:hypothetical protein